MSAWRTSSYSGQGGQCVEVGRVNEHAAVRDSKDREAGYFTVTGSQWSAFLDAVKSSRFD